MDIIGLYSPFPLFFLGSKVIWPKTWLRHVFLFRALKPRGPGLVWLRRFGDDFLVEQFAMDDPKENHPLSMVFPRFTDDVPTNADL